MQDECLGASTNHRQLRHSGAWLLADNDEMQNDGLILWRVSFCHRPVVGVSEDVINEQLINKCVTYRQ